MRRGAGGGLRARLAALLVAAIALFSALETRAHEDDPVTPPVLGAAIERLLAGAQIPDVSPTELGDVAGDLSALYPAGAALPLWSDTHGPTAAARASIDALDLAPASGLRADDYVSIRLRSTAQNEPSSWEDAQRAWFDVALSASVLRYAGALHHGRVAYAARDFNLSRGARPLLDGAAVIRQIAGGADPAATLAALEPPLSLYRDLKKALPIYRDLAARSAALPPLGALGKIRPGDVGTDLTGLRALLVLVGDLAAAAAAAAPADLYDPALVDAVRRFQARHGLDPDGIVGANTKRALAVPLSRRAAAIAWNLERLRWLPRSDATLIVVNIPEFRLRAFRDPSAEPDLSMNVIVGSAVKKHDTVAFASEMRGVAFWPHWNVPQSITRREMLEHIARDPNYLARQNMEIVARGEDGASRVIGDSPEAVAALRSGGARLRQRPGAHNSLGSIKFLMPNAYNIYLHDTPSVGLFAYPRRDFSHGCVRVGAAVDLAEFVLSGTGDWDRSRIEAALAAHRTRHVTLSRPIPVWIVYLTAVAAPDGEASFFDDIYERDDDLARRLR